MAITKPVRIVSGAVGVSLALGSVAVAAESGGSDTPLRDTVAIAEAGPEVSSCLPDGVQKECAKLFRQSW